MKCPNCDKPVLWKDNPFRPFCSERCQMIDFGHWVDEDYAVPGEDLYVSPDQLDEHDGAAADAARGDDAREARRR